MDSTDKQIAGPSRPKRTCVGSNNKRPLTQEELEDEAANIFLDSGSEFELSEESDNDYSQDLDDSSSSSDDFQGGTTDIPGHSQQLLTSVPGSFLWGTNPNLINIPFTGTSGLLVPVPDPKPYDYFSLLVDDMLLQLIVEETNVYAQQLLLSETSERSRITEWKTLSISELKVFLGLWLHMGTIHLNRIQDYWRKHELFSSPCFPKYMSRNRFLLILRCLHFSKNPEDGEPVILDRMHKIRPIQNYLNNKMDAIYYPQKELSLDESVVLWRGRLQFKQYIKNKKHKYGLKLYLLTEPNGVVLRCLLYTGAADNLGGKGHAANIVFALMEGKLEKGHSIYMDNFYNSVSLGKQLLARSTYVTGTLRKDRGDNSKEVVQAKLKKGDTKTAYAPMSGVDRQDQMLAYYPSERKTIRWYKKLFIHYISMLLFNSYLLFQKHSGDKKNFFEYRLAVIQDLLPTKTFEKKLVNNPSIGQQHLPSRYRKDSGRPMRKRCKWCYKKKIQKLTQFFCNSCQDFPGLCIEPCFREYHKEQNK